MTDQDNETRIAASIERIDKTLNDGFECLTLWVGCIVLILFVALIVLLVRVGW